MSTPHVLVVEDDPSVRGLLQTLLSAEGYDVATASDGLAGLVKASSRKPALILLDLMMPDLGGVRVLEELRGDPALAEIPVIVVTGQIDAVPAMQESGTSEGTGQVLSRYVSMIVIRTFGQDRIENLAAASDVPVVNALTDYAHPCQALADLQTIREKKGTLAGLTLAYLGDGNNMAHSLLLAGALAGMHVRVASPPGFEPIEQVVRRANEIGEHTGGEAVVTNDP